MDCPEEVVEELWWCCSASLPAQAVWILRIKNKTQLFYSQNPNGTCSPACWLRQAHSTCTTPLQITGTKELNKGLSITLTLQVGPLCAL